MTLNMALCPAASVPDLTVEPSPKRSPSRSVSSYVPTSSGAMVQSSVICTVPLLRRPTAQVFAAPMSVAHTLTPFTNSANASSARDPSSRIATLPVLRSMQDSTSAFEERS